MKLQVTDGLSVDLDTELWACARCGRSMGPARGNYKEHCLVAARDPREVHGWSTPDENGLSFAPDPDWCRIVEFYCPGCAALLEVEYLPPGHPPTHDIQLDVDALKRRFRGQEESS